MHPGDQTLRSGLFIAGGAVDLTGAIEPRHIAQLERLAQRTRIEVVVLNGIAWDHHIDLLQALHRPQHCQLDVCGK